MEWARKVLASRPVQMVLALTYLYPPGFMIFVWFRFIYPDDPGTGYDVVFLIIFLVFCWHGFGWFYCCMRQALGRSDEQR